jgi:hypothetical protein
MWERTVEADLGGRYIGEIAITITSQQMLINDTGVVLVGGRLNTRSDLVQHTLHNNNNNGNDGRATAEFDYRRQATSVADEGQPSPDDDDDDKLAHMNNNDNDNDNEASTKLSRLARKLTIPTDEPSTPSATTQKRRLLHAGPVDEEDPDREGNEDLEQETLLDNKRHFGDKQVCVHLLLTCTGCLIYCVVVLSISLSLHLKVPQESHDGNIKRMYVIASFILAVPRVM